MALFHTTVVDNQIKALDTIGSVSGSIATFETDKDERLVSCVCEVASGSSEVNITACGANVWNEEWELGDFDNQGNRISGNYVCSKTPIKINPNASYYFYSGNANGRVYLYYYDSNMNYLVGDNFNPNTTFTTPNNAVYVNFLRGGAYGTTYGNDISINSKANDITYNQYNGTTYNIQLGETLSSNGSFDVLSGILTRSDDTTKHVDGNVITAQVGENNIYADTGDIIHLKFVLSVGKAIS